MFDAKKYKLAALMYLSCSAHLLMSRLQITVLCVRFACRELMSCPTSSSCSCRIGFVLILALRLREMVNSVAISLSIYTDVLFVLAQSQLNGMSWFCVWHQQFYSHAEVNDSYCIWHCLWWCKLLFVTRSSWQTILPLWHYRFMCWSEVVFLRVHGSE